jgi:hypothetical protein
VIFLVADVCATSVSAVPDNKVSDGRLSSQMQFATKGIAQTSATKKITGDYKWGVLGVWGVLKHTFHIYKKNI